MGVVAECSGELGVDSAQGCCAARDFATGTPREIIADSMPSTAKEKARIDQFRPVKTSSRNKTLPLVMTTRQRKILAQIRCKNFFMNYLGAF